MGILNKVVDYLWTPPEPVNKGKVVRSFDDDEVSEFTRQHGADYPINKGTMEDYLRAYEVSAWVYICVSKIVNHVAQVPLKVWRRSPGSRRDEWADLTSTEPTHGLVTLLQKPNPWMTEFEFKQGIVGSLQLGGNSYIEIVGDQQPQELYILLPHKTKVVPDAKKFIMGYIYDVGGGVKYLPDEITHIKLYSSRNQYYGLSPIQAAELSISTDVNAAVYNKNFFENSAVPYGMITTEQELNESAYRRIQKWWQKAHGGTKNAYRVAIGELGVKWQQTQVLHKDMEFSTTRKLSREEIMGVYGVPPVIAGIMEYAAYANCLPGHVRVLTTKGYKRIDSVISGDKVFSYHLGDLKANKVRKLFKNGVKKIYEIKDNRGHKIQASGNHPFLIYRNGGLQWVRADELNVGDRAVVLGNNYSLGKVCFCGCGSLINDGCQLYLPGHNLRVDNPMKHKDAYEKCQETILGFSNKLCLCNVVSIDVLGEEATFDIEVANSHNFVAEGFVVHNSNEQRRIYWEHTIAPLMALVQDKINSGIVVKFNDPDLFVEFDTTAIQAMRESRESEARVHSAYVDRGIKTINEIRRELGFEPVAWGGVWYPPQAGGLSIDDIAAMKEIGANGKGGRGDRFGGTQGSLLGPGPKGDYYSQQTQDTKFPSEDKLGKQFMLPLNFPTGQGVPDSINPFLVLKLKLLLAQLLKNG